MSVERYGPQADEVQNLIAMCETLTVEQMTVIADAVKRRGMNRGAWEAWDAAKTASSERERQAGAAAWDVEMAVSLRGFSVDQQIVRACARAANDAGLAVATRDLVGVAKYGPWDYDKLMSAWRAGAGDPT